MAVRWAAVTFRETEKHYRRITGYEHMWMLKAHLDDEDGALAEPQKQGNLLLSPPTFNYRRDTLDKAAVIDHVTRGFAYARETAAGGFPPRASAGAACRSGEFTC